MRYFDEQTAEDLEFPQIRKWLQSFAQTETVQSRFQRLQPFRKPAEAERSLELSHELQLIRNRGLRFPRLELKELKKELKFLQISGSVLEVESLINLLDASRLVNQLFGFFKEEQEQYPYLFALLQHAYPTKAIEKAMEKVFDRRLQIKDEASEDLLRIRQGIAGKRKQINRNFDKALKAAQASGYVSDIKENTIDGRRVLTVLSSYKRQVDGSILGASNTGSLTYIEPKVNQALNRELDQLMDDERKEIRRILAELTDQMRAHLELLVAYQEIIVAYDAVNAKVKLAQKIAGVKPQLNIQSQDSYLKEAYHPILYVKNQEAKLKTIPQTFELKADKRLLVISGPNAGGKSITLKTMGLLQLMIQSGLMVPVSTQSRFAFFDYILSDIGDNQSIENQLSTYSYRLQRMNFFLSKLSPKSLLLLDEFGTGSDPELGGALAEVFFETLYEAGCFGVITTHYSNIKLKAAQLPEAENANMLFNRKTLKPEYQLMVGQPGSSFTFEVAQMNGIPKEMLQKAKQKVDGQKVKFDKLISDLQRDKSVLQKLKRESYQATRELENSREELEEKSSHYEERLERQQKRIERNNKYLSHGQKMFQFVQHLPKGKAKQTEYFKEVKKYLAIEKSKLEQAAREAQEAQRREEEALQAKVKKKQKGKQKQQRKAEPKPVVVGQKAKLKNSRQVGEVLSIDGKEATMVFGNMKAKVKLSELVGV
ncbi:MAG: DNA mismatch repair protein MutS [Vicingaceae bacterium]